MNFSAQHMIIWFDFFHIDNFFWHRVAFMDRSAELVGNKSSILKTLKAADFSVTIVDSNLITNDL